MKIIIGLILLDRNYRFDYNNFKIPCVCKSDLRQNLFQRSFAQKLILSFALHSVEHEIDVGRFFTSLFKEEIVYFTVNSRSELSLKFFCNNIHLP